MNKDDKTFKAFIFTDAGKHAGYGHLTRCMVLHEELKSRKIETQIYINADEDIVLQTNVQYFRWDSLDFEAIVNKNDICIVDSYQVTSSIEQRLSKITNKLLFIDDLGRYGRPGLVLNYSLNPIPPKKHNPNLLLGHKYALIREPFASFNNNYKVKKQLTRVLITLGGSKLSETAYEVLDILAPLYPHISFKAIVYEKKSNIDVFDNVILLNFCSPGELLSQMLMSDLIILAPSQTLFEVMRLKIPFMAIQTAYNQQNNTSDAYNYISLIHEKAKFHNTLTSVFDNLQSYNKRVSLQSRIKEFENASDKIIDLILKY